jgi:predicted dienelactone hydrolase
MYRISIILIPLAAVVIYFLVKDDCSVGTPFSYSFDAESILAAPVKTNTAFISWSFFITVGVDEMIHAWAFLPNFATVESPVPTVIMSHGLGSQKDMGLVKYASSFAEHGYGVVVIDYLSFGGSTTQHGSLARNHINPWNHILDIKRTLSFLRSGEFDQRFDSSRVALWGTSFAGGHMLMVY